MSIDISNHLRIPHSYTVTPQAVSRFIGVLVLSVVEVASRAEKMLRDRIASIFSAKLMIRSGVAPIARHLVARS